MQWQAHNIFYVQKQHNQRQLRQQIVLILNMSLVVFKLEKKKKKKKTKNHLWDGQG